MSGFDQLSQLGHEQVVLCSDPASGYRGIIAIHSTALGPAVGGTRWWTYPSDEAAMTDALRLSRAIPRLIPPAAYSAPCRPAPR